MKVFSLESLNKMSQHLKNNPDCSRLIDDYEAMVEELSIEFVPSSVDFDPSIIDLTPPDATDQKGSDSKNALSVYKSLNFLTPAQATDERLWATLALVYYSEYTRARWPIKNTSPAGKQILSHWLCKSSTRSRTRDNSISRLWWMGKIVNQLDGINQETASKVLFGNSDYRANIIERSSSAAAPNVMASILKITLDEYDNGNDYNRKAFRNFMKKVNFLAGRSNLSVLTEKQTEELLRPVYIECYEQIKPKKSLLEKLFN